MKYAIDTKIFCDDISAETAISPRHSAGMDFRCHILFSQKMCACVCQPSTLKITGNFTLFALRDQRGYKKPNLNCIPGYEYR